MAEAATVISTPEMQRYIELLYPDAPDDAWLVLSWLAGPNDFRSRWFLMTDIGQTLDCLAQLAPWQNTYIGLGLRQPVCTPDEHTRGTSADVMAIGGLWVELDHNAGVHSATNLPTPTQLQEFILNLPFRCSLLIDSGGGIHAYVLFKELWILHNAEEHDAAALLLRRFQRTVQLLASQHGWKVDSTADLARVLRPAGTLNHKGDIPRPVTILHEHAVRYNPSDITDAAWLATIEDTYTPSQPHGIFPPTFLTPIETGCAWVAHCHTDAATLTEPEWYALLGIVGRCEQGIDLAHAWSQPYPHYDANETTKKLEHALRDAGPRTCSGIRYDVGAESYCSQCQHWGKVKSPIVLGIVPTHSFGIGVGTTWPVNGTHSSGVQSRRDPEEQSAWYQEHIEPYANKQGMVKANNTTIMAFLQNHSYWQGKFWWDDMAHKPMMEQHELSDHLITHLGAIFGTKHRLAIAHDLQLARCLAAVCREHPHDPLQAYLQAISGWDGIHRLETWLTDCAGVTATPYHRFVSRILLVSMIARAFDPGCLYRNVIIFEGPEEYRKSTFVAALVPYKSWHTEMTCSFDSKDAPMMIQGLWIAELSELDSLSKTEETRLKAFISQTEDPYIPKFKIFRVAPKRRTIFLGTTNEGTYLKGTTGNTRFLPVHIEHPMDVEGFISIREQLYAEAMLFYGDHRQDWWYMPGEVYDEAKFEREQRRQTSVYEQDLATWLATGRFQNALTQVPAIMPVHHETSWAEIATGFLKLDTPEKWKDINLQKQIAQAMKALGWRQKLVRRSKEVLRLWVYEAPLPF